MAYLTLLNMVTPPSNPQGYCNWGGPPGSAKSFNPISYNGNLYWVLVFNGEAPVPVNALVPIYMIKSVDNGVSWTILDAGDGPMRPIGNSGSFPTPLNPWTDGGVFFDGAHTVTVGWQNGTFIAGPSLVGNLQLQDFNLATEAWGPIYGSGGPSALVSSYVFNLSGGKTAVFSNRGSSTAPPGLQLNWFDGAAWSSAAIDTFIGYSQAGCAVVYDPTNPSGPLGAFHVFGAKQYYPQGLVYQLVDAASGGLGTYVDLSSLSLSQATGDGVASAYLQNSSPIIVGNSVIFGASDLTGQFPILLIGTPLIAPTFTATGSIDPTYTYSSGASIPNPCPAVATDGSTIYGVVRGIGVLRVGSAPVGEPATGWSFASEAPGANMAGYPQIWSPETGQFGVTCGLLALHLSGPMKLAGIPEAELAKRFSEEGRAHAAAELRRFNAREACGAEATDTPGCVICPVCSTEYQAGSLPPCATFEYQIAFHLPSPPPPPVVLTPRNPNRQGQYRNIALDITQED